MPLGIENPYHDIQSRQNIYRIVVHYISNKSDTEQARQYLMHWAQHGSSETKKFLSEAIHRAMTIHDSQYEYEKTVIVDSHISYLCGVAAYFGLGQRVNKNKAFKYYCAAAESNLPEAQTALGHCYYHGHGTVKSLPNASAQYRLAANQGYVRAQSFLGYSLGHGLGVEKDLQAAIGLYRKAAREGYALAQFNLGYCLEQGRGVEQDLPAAIGWYRKAADQRNIYALFSLGCCYKDGKGVTQSHFLAAWYYRLAAERSHQDSLTALSNLDLSPLEKRYHNAILNKNKESLLRLYEEEPRKLIAMFSESDETILKPNTWLFDVLWQLCSEQPMTEILSNLTIHLVNMFYKHNPIETAVISCVPLCERLHSITNIDKDLSNELGNWYIRRYLESTASQIPVSKSSLTHPGVRRIRTGIENRFLNHALTYWQQSSNLQNYYQWIVSTHSHLKAEVCVMRDVSNYQSLLLQWHQWHTNCANNTSDIDASPYWIVTPFDDENSLNVDVISCNRAITDCYRYAKLLDEQDATKKAKQIYKHLKQLQLRQLSTEQSLLFHNASTMWEIEINGTTLSELCSAVKTAHDDVIEREESDEAKESDMVLGLDEQTPLAKRIPTARLKEFVNNALPQLTINNNSMLPNRSSHQSSQRSPRQWLPSLWGASNHHVTQSQVTQIEMATLSQRMDQCPQPTCPK